MAGVLADAGLKDAAQLDYVDRFTEEVFEFMGKSGLSRSSFFGYSMGGYVALNLAVKHPDRVERIFTIATKFEWTSETAGKETHNLNPERIKAKIPRFAEVLQERHKPNPWDEVVLKTATMIQGLGTVPTLSIKDNQQIEHPILICVGEEDVMVSIKESEMVVGHLSNGQLRIFPGYQLPRPSGLLPPKVMLLIRVLQ